MGFKQYLHLLTEKIIEFGNKQRNNQAVLVAGGSGSGKSHIAATLTNIPDTYKVADIDRSKKLLVALNRYWLKYKNDYKYKEIAGKELKNPRDSEFIHQFTSDMNIEAGLIYNPWMKIYKEKDKPNLTINRTFSRWEQIYENLMLLKMLGYKPQNIHILWVLTDYELAQLRNAGRDRVSDRVYLKRSHLRCADIFYDLFTGIEKLSEDMFNGEIYVVNNSQDFANLSAPQSTEWEKMQIKKIGLPIDIDGIDEKLFHWMYKHTPPESKVHKELK